MRSALPLGILLAAIAGQALAVDWITAPHGVPESHDIARLLKNQPLAASENIRVTPLQKTERSAQFLVQIRDREPLHYYADSDITVFILRGSGRIRIGERARPARAGDVIHITRASADRAIRKITPWKVRFISDYFMQRRRTRDPGS